MMTDAGPLTTVRRAGNRQIVGRIAFGKIVVGIQLGEQIIRAIGRDLKRRDWCPCACQPPSHSMALMVSLPK